MPFNAEKFLNHSVDAPMSTVTVPCPEGEYKAFIDDGEKAITFREGGTSANGTELSPQCVVMFAIMNQAPNDALKRDKVLVPMNCWLDLTDDGEHLDLSEGKNVGLGRLRKALDQNSGAWNPMMMKGKGPVMIKVSQRSDKNDPTQKYAEVNRVSKIENL
jgi:hypothetical protein